jgi:hypothetical protein
VKIVHGDWKKAIIVRGNRRRPGRPPREGVIAMASLKGSLPDQTLRHAFSDAGRCNRLSWSSTREPMVAGRCTLAAQTLAAIDHNGGHLDFLVAGYDTSPPSGNPLGSTVARLAAAITAMTDDNTAMHAGVARMAHDEGIADWFETVAMTGRSHAGEMRRALDNNDECMRNR